MPKDVSNTKGIFLGFFYRKWSELVAHQIIIKTPKPKVIGMIILSKHCFLRIFELHNEPRTVLQ